MSQFGGTIPDLKRPRRRGRSLLVCEEDDLKFLSKECCPEACCLPNGTCEHMLPVDCVKAGGAPQGAGTDCNDPDINCELTQACCFTDGSCVDVPPAECVAIGGTPQGPETECITTECVTGCPDSEDCLLCPDIVTVSYHLTGTLIGFAFGGAHNYNCIIDRTGDFPANRQTPCHWIGSDGCQPNDCEGSPFTEGHDRITMVNPFSPAVSQGVSCAFFDDASWWFFGFNMKLYRSAGCDFSTQLCQSAVWGFRKPNTDNCPRGDYSRFIMHGGECSPFGDNDHKLFFTTTDGSASID